MKFIIVLLILINASLVIKAIPPVKHFHIDDNENICAKLDLSADFTIYYDTNNGTKSATLNMSESIDNQKGLCSLNKLDTKVQFNISIPPTENLVLNFINQNNSVELNSVYFIYNTPNENLPDADKTGMVIAYAEPNVKLSNTNSYFECNSRVHFNLTNGVIINVYSTKIKVFNVVNSSFGSDKEECSQDFNHSSTVSTTSPHPTTGKASTTPITTTWSTSTTKTSNPTYKTTQTSDFTSLTKARTTNPFTTPHISTSTPKLTSTQSTNDFVYKVSANNRYCLLLKSGVAITIKYNSTANQVKTRTFNILHNATYFGSCSYAFDILVIKWVSGLSINLTFANSSSSSNLNQIIVKYKLSPEYFPDALNKGNATITESEVYSDTCKMPITNSYKCTTVNFDIGSISLKLSNFQYEAFQNSISDTISNPEISCDARNPLVAIIVGVVLAVFLILVVIVFLIFRYRASKKIGYEEI